MRGPGNRARARSCPCPDKRDRAYAKPRHSRDSGLPADSRAPRRGRACLAGAADPLLPAARAGCGPDAIAMMKMTSPKIVTRRLALGDGGDPRQECARKQDIG